MQILQRATRWTEVDYEYIKENWQTLTDDEMGEYLGRSARAVKTRREKYGLYRPRKKGPHGKKSPMPSYQEVK